MINTRAAASRLSQAAAAMRAECEALTTGPDDMHVTEVIARIDRLRALGLQASSAYGQLAVLPVEVVSAALDWRETDGAAIANPQATLGAVLAAGQAVIDAYRVTVEPAHGGRTHGALPVGDAPHPRLTVDITALRAPAAALLAATPA